MTRNEGKIKYNVGREELSPRERKGAAKMEEENRRIFFRWPQRGNQQRLHIT